MQVSGRSWHCNGKHNAAYIFTLLPFCLICSEAESEMSGRNTQRLCREQCHIADNKERINTGQPSDDCTLSKRFEYVAPAQGKHFVRLSMLDEGAPFDGLI